MELSLQDPRIQRGMQAQLSLRQARLDAGDRPLGWKVGFGAPAALQTLGTSAPLIGFLTEAARLPSGASVSVAGWKNPALEPEIAVYLGADLPGGSDLRTVQAAIRAIGPAIELADVDFPPQDPAAILAGNIYNRHVVLGDSDLTRPGASLEGLVGRLLLDGVEQAASDDPAALTGNPLAIVAYAATLLERVGARLRAGEVIITGSIIPPVMIARRGQFRYILEPIGEIEVNLRLET